MSDQYQLPVPLFKKLAYYGDTRVVELINKYSADYDIGQSKRRVVAFLAVSIINTIAFFKPVETIKYKSAQASGFYKDYKNYLESEEQAFKLLQTDQETLFNNLYANVNGNGNANSGDGYKYRKRTGMAFLGRNAYERIGFLDNPDELSDLETSIKVTMKYWQTEGLNELADKCDVSQLNFKSHIRNLGNKLNFTELQIKDLETFYEVGMSA